MKIFLASLLVSLALGMNPLPSLQSGLGRGYDILTGDWKGPVYNWNYNNGNSYTDPLTKTRYDIPDEVMVVNTPQADLGQTDYKINNMSDYQTMEQKWHHLGISIPGVLSFKYTKEAMKMADFLQNGTSTVFLNDKFFSFYKMAVWPLEVIPGQENSHFASQVNALPATYSSTGSSAQAYNIFLDSFGTHFSNEASFGGELRYYTVVDNQIYQKHTEEWVYKQVSIAVSLANFGLGIQNGSNKTEVSNDRDFTNNMNITISSFGGSASTVTKGYKTWYQTTVNNPAILRPTLVPISEAAAVVRPSIVAPLNQAIDDYMRSPPA